MYENFSSRISRSLVSHAKFGEYVNLIRNNDKLYISQFTRSNVKINRHQVSTDER